jgi:hypothetical protein
MIYQLNNKYIVYVIFKKIKKFIQNHIINKIKWLETLKKIIDHLLTKVLNILQIFNKNLKTLYKK